MSVADRSIPRDDAAPAGSRAHAEEEKLRERWETAQSALLERFDEPISKATALTRRTLALFPVRVWRHFLQHNGFLLAAGVSYQALFSIFAAVFVAFEAFSAVPLRVLPVSLPPQLTPHHFLRLLLSRLQSTIQHRQDCPQR